MASIHSLKEVLVSNNQLQRVSASIVERSGGECSRSQSCEGSIQTHQRQEVMSSRNELNLETGQGKKRCRASSIIYSLLLIAGLSWHLASGCCAWMRCRGRAEKFERCRGRNFRCEHFMMEDEDRDSWLYQWGSGIGLRS